MRFLIIFILCFSIACKNESKKVKESSKPISNKIERPKEYFKVKTQSQINTFAANEQINFDISLIDSLQQIDSIQIFLNDNPLHVENQLRFSLTINPQHVGKNKITCTAFFRDGSNSSKSSYFTFLSDIDPKNIEYSLIKTHPHSTDHFTQGIVYEEGFLYEGTGEFGFSTLVKTKLETSEIIQSLSLASNRFGEGIALFNNKIVQITYKAKEGYVYDKTSFEKIWKFDYPYSKEGWGLTATESELLMSNGTNKIISLDTSNFSFLKEIQVYDNKTAVNNLNELEYIDGLLYANIWMDNRIAQIDPKTGKVLGYIDCTQLIPNRYKSHHSHVLNGIAVIPKNGHLLLTGKRWDIIYEIELK
ncbi:MAG: glutaminyl-peptide cyclotransferase [Flavobacteriales bacterium]|nr:glutaminyl-peptide cyclotransferase [Flavobacteriales bacterium]